MKNKLISLMISSCIALPVFAAEDNLLSNIIVSLDANQIESVTGFINDYSISTKYIYSHVFTGFSATVPSNMLEQLSRDSRVLSVSKDGRVHATKSTSKVKRVKYQNSVPLALPVTLKYFCKQVLTASMKLKGG